jgi:hypothetical protein
MPAETAMSPGEVDFSKPFFPVRMTALAHVPSWSLLEPRHQLRYSQLYALYLNEQTVFFEELLATNVLPALYNRPDRIGSDLAEDLRRFEQEERGHSRWFRQMNHLVDPTRFSLEEGTYVFIPADARIHAVTGCLARKPFAFPGWIWLMLLQEERSIAVSRECLRDGAMLEPSFLELHRKHMADEVDHVEWDIRLIERIWLRMPLWKRRLHARLFAAMMTEFFTAPKRSAKVLLGALLDEFSELATLGPQLHRELSALAVSPAYHASLYSRKVTPRCFSLFDELPEFDGIGRSFLAYQRP